MKSLINKFKIQLTRQAKYRQVYRELNVLTDRELSDIGINRSDIYRIAKESMHKS